MVKKYKFDWKATKDKIKKEEESKAQQFGDDRFWKLDIDKDSKKGSAIIRFLPDRDGTPYKKYFSHWFIYNDKGGNKQYYTLNCATTVGKPCPVCEKNRDLFNSAYETDKETGRERKRRIHYVSNILVIKDKAHEENEGKIFLFDYGPQVFEKFHTAMFGKEMSEEDKKEAKDMGVEIDESELFVPCDFEEGANFFYRSTLKETTGKQKWNTYENSKFIDNTGNIFPDLDADEWDEKVDETMKATHMVDEWGDPQNFPHENKVRAKLAAILGEFTPEEREDAPIKSEVSDPKVDEDNTSEDPELEKMLEEETPATDQDDDDFLKTLLDDE